MKSIEIQLLREKAKLPVRANPTDSGLDCYACDNYEIVPFEGVLIPLGFKINLEHGFEAQIRPKSGYNIKHILTQFGTIDQPYTGEVAAYLINLGQTPFSIKEGQKVCQLVVSPVVYPEPVEVETINKVTNRGDGGFGSTGVF